MQLAGKRLRSVLRQSSFFHKGCHRRESLFHGVPSYFLQRRYEYSALARPMQELAVRKHLRLDVEIHARLIVGHRLQHIDALPEPTGKNGVTSLTFHSVKWWAAPYLPLQCGLLFALAHVINPVELRSVLYHSARRIRSNSGPSARWFGVSSDSASDASAPRNHLDHTTDYPSSGRSSRISLQNSLGLWGPMLV